MLGAPTRRVLAAATTRTRPLQPFLLERFDGWNDSTMSLSSSECEPLSLQELLSYADDEGKERWDKLSLGYIEPSNGSLYLRREVLKAQQFLTTPTLSRSTVSSSLNEDCVNICAPQEGIFLAIQALCSPGDHVVVVAPAYQSLHEIASSLGCQVTSWWPEQVEMPVAISGSSSFSSSNTTLAQTSSWRFHPDTLEKLIRPNQTKLVVANFPHNPTGALPSLDDYQKMIDIVQANGSWFLVDEMYRGLEHPHQGQFVPPLPPVAACMPRGISLGGVSKSHGLPGLRIGWLVNGQELVSPSLFQKRVAELKDYTTICPPAPSEALAFVALRAQEALWQRSRRILAQGLPVLRQFIQQRRQSFTWSEPLGGTFAWVKFNNSRDDRKSSGGGSSLTASQYCNTLRQRTGLTIVPSSLFTECKAKDDHLRLTFGKKGLDLLLQVWDRELQQAE